MVKERDNRILDILDEEDDEAIVIDTTVVHSHKLRTDRETSGPRREKTCIRGFANNTGADQPAHHRSLISAFVISFKENFIRKLAPGEISII